MLSRTKVAVCGAVILLLAVAYDFNNKETTVRFAAEQQVVPPPVAGDTWKKFTSVNNEFSVLLPTLPQHVQEKVTLPNGKGAIEYHMYLSQEKDGTTLMISMIQYPQAFDTSKPDLLLENVMKEMASGSTTNELQNVEKGAFQSFPALDFSIENKDFSLRCKAFLHNKTLYVLSVIDRTAAGDINAVFDKFMNSFELLNGEPPATPQPTM